MGQRHQFWLIAKINSRFRVVAALHHQWCYSVSAPRALARLFCILGNPANQTLIRHELTHAATFADTIWPNLADNDSDDTTPADSDSQTPKIKGEPFPFTAAAFALGIGFDPRKIGNRYGYFHDAHPLPITCEFTDVDNNDGFSIVDVTDPSSPRYCFLLPNALTFKEWSRQQPEDCPLTPEEYVAVYKDTLPADLANLFAKTNMIDADALRDLWPTGSWRDRETLSLPIRPNAPGPETPEPTKAPSTLKNQALKKAVDLALDDVMYEDALPLEIPNFHRRLREHLQGNPGLVKRPNGVSLLAMALKGTVPSPNVDLSIFPYLQEEDILRLVSALDDNTTHIDISHNEHITPSGVSKLLSIRPTLRTLLLLHTPKCPYGPELAAAFRLSPAEVFHTGLQRASLQRGDYETEVANIATAAPRSGCVANVLYVGAAPTIVSKLGGGPRFADGGLRWVEFVEACASRGCRRGNYDVPGVWYQVFSVADRGWDAASIESWMPRLAQYLMRHKDASPGDLVQSHTWYGGLRCALAVDTRDEWKIHPFAIDLSYHALPSPRGMGFVSDTSPTHPARIEPGRWTLVVTAEMDWDDEAEYTPWSEKPVSLRCAFVTREEGEAGKLVVADVDDWSAKPGTWAALSGRPAAEADGSAVENIDWSRLSTMGREEVEEIIGPLAERVAPMAAEAEKWKKKWE